MTKTCSYILKKIMDFLARKPMELKKLDLAKFRKSFKEFEDSCISTGATFEGKGLTFGETGNIIVEAHRGTTKIIPF